MTHSKVFWFIVGSQHLYGEETLAQVERQAREVAVQLARDGAIPFDLIWKPIVTTSEEIRQMMLEANADGACAGVITWMHTFSPAKMWIAGLSILKKPMLHLHTQYHRGIPWNEIDMDFMNLNQSAHGDREYGFLATRLRISRKVIVGHWADEKVRLRIGGWMRTAVGYAESQELKIARFGDNMRDVAVTEGDKVEAQARFGWAVNGYGVGDLVDYIRNVTDEELELLVQSYREQYEISSTITEVSEEWNSIREQARIEVGMRAFLEDHQCRAFTTTFEDLHGLAQLPGLAVQRLMGMGYGFGGEGDWKTAALTRIMKVMADLEGTSFMEDYTYHMEPGDEFVLGAHMLEVCPTISADRPRLEVHPLSIGGKANPARLVFNGRSGSAVVASLVDLGNRFRLIVNEVKAVEPKHSLPKLPVARVFWKPKPSLCDSAEAWIYAGGAHHTVFSYNVSVEQLVDFAAMAGIECVVIDDDTSVLALRNLLEVSDLAWRLN